MESYSKEILRKKVIKRILKCSTEYSLVHLYTLNLNELFEIQSFVFKDLLLNSGRNIKLEQTY
jgi:hypothetical protein